MAKPTRINPSEREIHTPAPVIHRIQSFLSGKQAAQTALVCKSWYNAWLTRPDLYFSEGRFVEWHPDVFWDFVDRSVQRYEELNLNFNSLYLRVHGVDERAAKLIKKVLKLGVNIDCKIKFIGVQNDLPLDVLEADTIVRLSLFDAYLFPLLDVGKLKLSRIKSLKLERMFLTVYNECLFSNAFPCLEDLTLVHCETNEEFEISSTSLKFISITSGKGIRNGGKYKLRLNVPNIRRFIFLGLCIPSIALIEVSREWEAEISIKHCHEIMPGWYNKLKELLRRLGPSMCKVSLSIRFDGFEYDDLCNYHPDEQKVPTVENLMLSLPPIFYGVFELFDTLLCNCRPKIITQYWFPESSMVEKGNNRLIKYMCKKMFRDNLLDPYCSLEYVNVEIFEESLGEWQPLQWTALLYGYKGPENKRKIHFLLDWIDD